MKQLFPALWGNEDLRRRIGDGIINGTLSHAYAIQGPSGTGKRLLASQMAAALVCENKSVPHMPLPCGECRACRLMLSKGTPDLMVINREDKATIGVEKIHRMREHMYLSSTEFDRMVFIIEEADKMTAAAQNAMLVMIEEPPTNVTVLLLCEDTSALLTTVRSRVQTLRLSSFPLPLLTDFILQNNRAAQRMQSEDPARFANLLAASEGSPGRALSLFSTREGASLLALREDVAELASCLGPRVSYSRLQAAVNALPQKKREELSDALQIFTLALRDMILFKRDEEAPLCFFATAEEVRKISETVGLRCLFAVADATAGLIDDLARNGNITVLLTAFTDTLRHAHRS